MTLKVYKTLWGHDGSIEDAVRECLAAGFHGIEGPVPGHVEERKHFIAVLRDHGLSLIAEICTATTAGLYVPLPGKTVEEHLDSLRQGIERSLEAKPAFINTMAGSDAWSFSEVVSFHAALLALESDYGTTITLETHRGRPTHNPWILRDLLKELPELKLNCDFSHFCVVTERLVLDEDPGMLELFASRAHHLHARVGYPQGPQVPDPRAPEYGDALAAHERWWDVIWSSQRERGFEFSTITPEFGPDGYLQCAPYSLEPVADLWEINQWIGQRQVERFNQRFKQ